MAKLTSSQLKSLPDEYFGLPKTRQYPMPDEEHVIKAIQFFRYCKPENKDELAKNINRRAKELKMHIKVQPSSAFYKYADRSILKEGMIVTEFHIGQLSPIVPIQPERILSKFQYEKPESNDAPFVTQMDKIKKIWDNNKKSEAEKGEMSSKVIKEWVETDDSHNLELFTTFEAIDTLCYMTNSCPSHVDHSQLDDSVKERLSDRDNDTLMGIMNIREDLCGYTSNNDDECKVKFLLDRVRSINNINIRNFALTYIKYTVNIPSYIKDSFFSKYYASDISLRGDHTKDIMAALSQVTPNTQKSHYKFLKEIDLQKNMSEEGNEYIDHFVRMLPKPEKLDWVTGRLAAKKIDLSMYERDMSSIVTLLPNIISNCSYKGYRIFLNKARTLYFFEGYSGQIVYAILFSNTTDISKKILFCLEIKSQTHVTQDDYNNKILTYVLGGSVPGFKLNVNTIGMDFSANNYNSDAMIPINISERDSYPLTEETFADLIDSIKINGNGNISFVIGMDRTWREKVELCRNEMNKNLGETKPELEDLTAFKHNLCFLFAIISIINRDYMNWSPDNVVDKGSDDYKDAIKTMDTAINLFKKGITDISKRDSSFDFVKFFIDNKYYAKLDIFDNRYGFSDPKELESVVTNSYNWIMH